MTSDAGNFNPVVTVNSTYDATAHAGGLDIKSPEMLLGRAGSDFSIENRGGLVKVTNKYGSIYQNSTINAGELKLTSGGNLFIANKGSGITNLGPHPQAAFSNYVDPREDQPGFGTGANSLGGCNDSSLPAPLQQTGVSCSVGTIAEGSTPQFSGNDSIISAGKIFVVANTINLNGLIQSGIAEKTLTIGDLDGLSGTALMNRFGTQVDSNGNGVLDSSEWTDQNSDGVFTTADLAGGSVMTLVQEADNGTFHRPGGSISREVKGLYDAYYDPSDDSVIVSGFAPAGGEVFMAGKLISTGNGQINVMDGFATMNIQNNSGKDIKLTDINAGEVEGKITLIDNMKADSSTKLAKVTQYTRIGNQIVVNEGFGNPTTDVSSSYTRTSYGGDAQRVTSYTPQNGARYYWMNGEYVEKTRTWDYYLKTEGIFWGAGKWSADSFNPGENNMDPALMDPTQLPSADYASVEPSVGDDYRFRTRYEQTFYENHVPQPGTNEGANCQPNVLCYRHDSYSVLWGLYTRYQWWLDGYEEDFGNYYYYHDVEADRPVDIRFIGSDSGTVAINSNAGIRLAGNVINPSGTTSLIATDDIIATTDLAKMDVADLSLSATNIGDDNRSIRLIQGNSDEIDISANGNVYLKSLEGNMNFDQFANTGSGTVDLYAGESLSFNTASPRCAAAM